VTSNKSPVPRKSQHTREDQARGLKTVNQNTPPTPQPTRTDVPTSNPELRRGNRDNPASSRTNCSTKMANHPQTNLFPETLNPTLNYMKVRPQISARVFGTRFSASTATETCAPTYPGEEMHGQWWVKIGCTQTSAGVRHK
jgi:hypothetical protein